jgi:hypothetical protein
MENLTEDNAGLEQHSVRATLAMLNAPEAQSVWVGPFEQLHGAGYSLLAAIRHGVCSRNIYDYNVRVRTKIVALLLEQDATGRVNDRLAFDNALAGFYFNAAIQRVVWASERLIKTFVGIPCICRRCPENHANSRKFHILLRDAKTRIEHLRLEHKTEMAYTAEMLDQFPGEEYKREMQCNPKSILAMLRYDVNNRKHAIFGPLARNRRTANEKVSVEATWSNTPQNRQMQLACKAFDQVCRSYDELRSWQPSASVF